MLTAAVLRGETMTTADTIDAAPRARTPWHLWVVGVVGLLWNAFGCYDYTMTNLQGAPYLRSMGMTQPQIDYFNAMPAWMHGAWAVGVWGALLATVLLLARSKWAVWVYLASFVAVLVSLFYNFVLTDGAEIMGDQSAMMFVIAAAALGFLLYSAWAAKRGWLR